jgi:hypothetical protein
MGTSFNASIGLLLVVTSAHAWFSQGIWHPSSGDIKGKMNDAMRLNRGI